MHLMTLNQPVLNFYLGVDVTLVGLNTSCLLYNTLALSIYVYAV